ncbi:uncharacterized protein TRIADDRAFT_19019 [Trichoplax adhaerens]|uniref:DNA/RNA-binding protein Kin17 WH-like domain-containing protein n=1 Tax=Trichoplax adhaerens TaxID=10228 RepID=B3RM38_TRIAD|nr:hypothetical protein TRIADDRAFT_19019 [Trichoplax adhaerens]EDV28896.1 hypothetical protein TRIADDRAFT_19019 [Trichoplax adhaerens]|eukprot:XP_002108098.1 hypothetical protein TRIADDRAFT_19019 [Trichoplax adhaerens]
MGKNGGFLTPKAIANRIKAKGLQKLRWYCQVCQKQCRDENGFKCHTMSESHQRQLLLVADNPDQFVDGYSKEFEEDFIYLLKRRFGSRRIHANVVYQEYIGDRHHVHMNSTCWETLTSFVKYLGREGKCAVDHTEKGWFVSYIDRDPEVLARQELLKSKEKMELDDAERNAKYIQQQISKSTKDAPPKPTELKREGDTDKVLFVMPNSSVISKKKSSSLDKLSPLSNINTGNSVPSIKRTGEKRKSALEDIMVLKEKKKSKLHGSNCWLRKGIIVKILNKELGDKFYKRKCLVKDVVDQYIGVVEVLGSSARAKIDQADLETVLPSYGRHVMILKGKYRGLTAILESLDSDKYCVSIRLDEGSEKGKTLHNMAYEAVSKIPEA